MHLNLHDAYHITESWLHRTDPRAKLLATLLLILLIGLTPFGGFLSYAAYLVLLLIMALSTHISPALLWRRALLVLPFAGAAATVIFTVPGNPLGAPFLGLTITDAGLARFASILLKAVASAQVAVLLLATTPFTDTLWAASALRLPAVLVAIVSFMYRYLFVIADEALRLNRARLARSVELPGQRSRRTDIGFQARTTGRLIGVLLVRSLERSERVYNAMLARGYAGEIRRLAPPPVTAATLTLPALTLLIGLAIFALAYV